MTHQVTVPASSANLGPGFDALGLALGIYLTCRFKLAAELRITASGRDAGLIDPAAGNLIWQTAVGIARNLGRMLPPIELEIHNDIPISIVASAIDSHGVARAVRLELPAKFGVGIVVPDFLLLTSEARGVLPTSYSKADTIFNVQRSALLIAALATGTVAAFPTALEDRLHQPYRAKLVPGLEDILKLRAPGLLGCALSGAGPSVIVFYERGSEGVCNLVSQIFGLRGHGSEVLHAQVPAHGYRVSIEE